MTISLIKQACDELGLSYQAIDDAGVFIRIDLGDGRFHHCIANNLGLNDEAIEKICKDKAYTHDCLSKYVRMPLSSSYIDSHPPEQYSGFKKFSSLEEIATDIMANHRFPLIVKPNSKSMGINVFLCTNQEEVRGAVTEVFNKNSYKYDHVLLVQEKVEIVKEFRVIVYNKEIQFVYQKDNTGIDAQFVGNMSPLHFLNAKAVLLDNTVDAQILAKLTTFIAPIFSRLNLKYAGLDIAQDQRGQLYLFEINTKPGFTHFIKDNGHEMVMTLFKKILSEL